MAAMRLCFLLFCLSLASVYSFRKLKDINDLINSGYANRYPRHGILLLIWLAPNVNLDNNNIMRLNFYPNYGMFGFHYFGNIDNVPLLPPLSSGQSYYSVGNLRRPRAIELPSYVLTPYNNNYSPERNMDRLIVSLDPNQPNRIFRVFATAHNRGRNDFNSSDTFEIDPALFLQITQYFYVNRHNVNEFLQLTGYSASCPDILIPRTKRSVDSQCEAFKLQIKTTTKGYSKLIWTNIPDNIFNTYKVYIEICQNTYSSDTNDIPYKFVKHHDQIDKSNGSLETKVLLNAGLQPQLRLKKLSSSDVFWYGPEVDGGPLVRIQGLEAGLQLCAANGKACARLYIKKTFSSWKSVLPNSWVGFYRRSNHNNESYGTYQYVVNFAKTDKTAAEDYDIYLFCVLPL